MVVGFVNSGMMKVRQAIGIVLGSILGTHDFSAFRASGGAPMSPVRTMYEAAVEEAAGNQLVCRIHGNGFLYHMVRNIIGTVANVGLGIITPQRFQEILDGCDRTKAAATAPACGLFLEEVDCWQNGSFCAVMSGLANESQMG